MKTIKFIFSRLFIVNLLAACIVLFILVWGMLQVLKIYTLHGQSIIVPDLRGMTVDQVEEQLTSRQLKFQVIDSTFADNLPPLAVIEQDPRPLSRVKEGRKIYLTVNATQPPKVRLPDMTDMSLRAAKEQLDLLGLRIGELVYKPDIALNVVLEQHYRGRKIEPGTMIVKGSAIDLVVGTGLSDTSIAVPRVLCLTLQEAEMVLKTNSLNLGAAIYDKTVKDTLRAVIHRQIPPPGEANKLKLGEAVDVFLTQSMNCDE